MQCNSAGGRDHLESSMDRAVAARAGMRSRDEWMAAVMATSAAVCAAHGCCEGDSVEEYERWDGMA